MNCRILMTTVVFLLLTVHGDAKKKKANLTKTQSCRRNCPSGQECLVQSDNTERCVCASRCKKRHKPVCGKDGILYVNHCELHRSACLTGKKIGIDWEKACLKKKAKTKDCPEEKLSEMKRLILETFEREIHRKVTINILIDELFFRYDKDNDHSISGYELKSLVTDYIMYNNIKELLQICHSTQWLNTADKDMDGFLSKYEFSWSFGSTPKVFMVKNDEKPMSGSNLTLRCQVHGYPVPAITWRKDDVKLNSNNRVLTKKDGELFIKGLTQSDNGLYSCEASNDFGIDRKQVEISVQEPIKVAPAIPGSHMFYVFANDGVHVIDPKTASTVTHISADHAINGTSSSICTGTRERPCNWGGAVSVNSQYIYAADFLGRRILVLDIAAQKFVQEVPTEDFPYKLKYFRSLDTVWILSWGNSSLDVLTEDEDDIGTLSVINEAGKVTIHSSIKAQMIDGIPRPAHDFFEAGNCELTNEESKYAYVTHIMEPGIHEVDLVTKQYSKFYNLSDYQCYGTIGLVLSQPFKYAFVQCYTNEERDSKAQMVMDLRETQIKAINSFNFGTPFVSPDGSFVMTLNFYAILTQYIDPAGQIYLFNDIESDILLSHLAFRPRDAGYDVYVTSKDQPTIIVLHVDPRGIKIIKFISTVGKPSGTRDWIHTERPIVIGCESDARYLATPATGEDAVVILDAEKREMQGRVEEIKEARTIVWVGRERR